MAPPDWRRIDAVVKVRSRHATTSRAAWTAEDADSGDEPRLCAADGEGQAGPGAARAGPVDGAVLGLVDVDSYEVRWSDGTRWSYVATADREVDGSEAVVHLSVGRLKGV